MIEKVGNIWKYYRRSDAVVCVTTNGFIKKNGECVMGRGVAYQATQRVPGIALELGRKVRELGNIVNRLDGGRILSFPVKHNFWEKADLDLIEMSAIQLDEIAAYEHDKMFYIPHPGCHNGKLNWKHVRKVVAPWFALPNIVVVDLE